MTKTTVNFNGKEFEFNNRHAIILGVEEDGIRISAHGDLNIEEAFSYLSSIATWLKALTDGQDIPNYVAGLLAGNAVKKVFKGPENEDTENE